MKLENTRTQMRKGILELSVLSIIARGEVYAAELINELRNAQLLVVEGTIYPLLTRLRKADLVEYRWAESSSGPPRKYYRLTGEGEDFLVGLAQTWDQLVRATGFLIDKTRKNPKSLPGG